MEKVIDKIIDIWYSHDETPHILAERIWKESKKHYLNKEQHRYVIDVSSGEKKITRIPTFATEEQAKEYMDRVRI